MGSGSSRTKAGFVLGTGAEITVEVGFTPKHVKLVREQDTGETEYSVAVDHFASMPDASGLKLRDDNTTARSAMILTGLVTIQEDPAGSFTIGTDTDLNVDGIGIYWYAAE
jgi:hypothetical protein